METALVGSAPGPGIRLGQEREAVLQFHCKSTGSSLVGGTAQGCQPSCVFIDVEMVSPNCLEHQAVR